MVLFYGDKLCIPKTTLWDYLFHELHAEGLIAHTGMAKTISLMEERYY